MSISDRDVTHIAELARISLSGQERERLREQLSRIVEYVDKLNEVDTSGIEPTSHVLDITNAFRDDRPVGAMPPDEVLANAPDRHGSFYRVPKIIE